MSMPKHHSGRSKWRRSIAGGALLGLFLLLCGDGTVHSAVIGGIDPLEVLKLQIKNNVLFVFDTSGSMKWPVDIDSWTVGGDDPSSRAYQAKRAVEQVINTNSARMNYGIASYNVLASQKLINSGQNFDNLAGEDGPFIYVSASANAAEFAGNLSNCGGGGSTAYGFFCDTTNTYSSYDSQTDGNELWKSFRNPHAPYPTTCTAGTNCRYYLESKFYRNNTEYHWNVSNRATTSASASSTTRYTAAPASYTCPNPPADLTGNNPDANGDGVADQPRPCVRMCNDATANCANYYYSSLVFENNGGASCGGVAVLNSVSACNADNAPAVLSAMRNEATVNASTGAIDGLTANAVTDYHSSAAVPVAGIRFDQATPIGASLDQVRTVNPAVFPSPPAAVVGKQRNFVIFLTDGDDTCSSGSTPNAQATTAARAAQALYYQGGGPGAGNTDPTHQAETLVIAFAAAIDLALANKIAQAGSGGTVGSGSEAGITCPADVPCRNAFPAQSTDQLVALLNNILEEIASAGTFSAAEGVVGTVFELVTSPASPLDPNTRYSQRVNLLFQSTFDLPGFDGHVSAYRNDGTLQPVTTTVNTDGIWESGDTLATLLTGSFETAVRGTGRPPKLFTFSEMHGGANVDTIGGSGSQAILHRKVFTSAGNGRFVRGDSNWDSSTSGGRNVVALWPPNQANLSSGISDIDPPVGSETSAVNAFDNALGIGPSSSVFMTFNDLKTTFGACAVTTDDAPGSSAGTKAALPAGCTDTGTQLATARKEARQILLAWAGGAKVVTGSDQKPRRLAAGVAGDEVTPPLLFTDRGWVYLDQTLAMAAVVTPPLRFTPNYHVREWVLFRDGRRGADRQGINEIDKGFGLRNPDYDDASPETKLDLKPRMTVLYIPANDGLHAVRAETSEELWNFVPWDQLSKLKDLLQHEQVVTPHTYMIASSVRVADIFMPGTFTLGGVSYDGRWRTVIVFGRGPGGKYYTAIDVTTPGPYTRDHLATNPPWVMWSRGNPDKDIGGAAVRSADTTAYSTMGYTWSVPAIGNETTTPEWRMYMGSGYSDISSEGATYYVVDATTGDMVEWRGLGDGTPTYFADNALVASPALYNSFQLDSPTVTQRSTADYVTRVYIPDVHGRIWKFAAGSGGMFANPGPSQPMTSGVGLLKINNTAQVFAEAGGDNRVTPPPAATPPFNMYGYRDTAGDGNWSTAGTLSFTIPFASIFRGTNQPGTAFNASGSGRVFYVGTRFNTADVSCLSSFDSILYGVGAESGGAAYDFTGDNVADLSTIFTGKKLQGPQMIGGAVVMSEGGSLGSPPPPGVPSSMPTPAPPTPAQVSTKSQSSGSPVCRQ